MDDIHPNFPPGLDLTIDATSDDQAIRQDLSYGIAGKIWPASYALETYLNPHTTQKFEPPCPLLNSLLEVNATDRVILELGSGVGYLLLRLSRIIQCSKLTLVLTDLCDVLPLLRENVERAQLPNGSVHVDVMSLAWGDVKDIELVKTKYGDKMDFILCSDLTYFPHLFEPLIQTLRELPANKVIIGYKIRSLVKEEDFWRRFGRYFIYEPVTECIGDKRKIFGADEGIFIFSAWKRETPLSEDVLDDTFDRILLGGIDAFD